MKTKNKNAEQFLQEFIETGHIKHGRSTVDGPRKRDSIAVFGKQLREHGKDWKDWKFSAQIKVTMVKKTKENPVELDVEKNKEKQEILVLRKLKKNQ